MGAQSSLADFGEFLTQISTNYSDIIVLHGYGHTHNDAFKVVIIFTYIIFWHIEYSEKNVIFLMSPVIVPFCKVLLEFLFGIHIDKLKFMKL